MIRIWHSGSKYQKIKDLINVSHKQLKAVLALEIKKLGLAFFVPKLGEFPLFNTFLDLTNFSLFDFPDLDNFGTFDFSYFLVCSIPSPITPNLLTALLFLFLIGIGLLPLFLLEAHLLPLFLAEASLLSNPIIFSIEINRVAILLKA